MVINDAVLADMKQEADELWARKREAEKAVEESSESKRVKELSGHWYAANRRYDAAKLLLDHEKTVAGGEQCLTATE